MKATENKILFKILPTKHIKEFLSIEKAAWILSSAFLNIHN